MWGGTYSLSYHMVSECRPVFPLAKMVSAGGSQNPQARPFAKKLLWGCLLERITGFWQALGLNWIPRREETIRKWRKRPKQGNCTEWPRFTTFWRCSRAAKIYVLHRRNLALNAGRWPPWDTFLTPKRSSKHPGHSFHMMVRLHSNCQKDLLCHHLYLQRTSLEDKLKSLMSTESE